MGLEAVLVPQGGLRDVSGHYFRVTISGSLVRGDVAVADDTLDHRPAADGATDCIIFIAWEAPAKLTGPFRRLLQRIIDGTRLPEHVPIEWNLVSRAQCST
jgi:putative transcriptional regulator